MASTKLIVLKSKEIIYTLIFAVLIILLIIVMIMMFRKKSSEKDMESSDLVTTEADSSYEPGTYSSTITLGESTVSVMVTVDSDSITDVSLKNLDEAVTTMYPLLESSAEDINTQLQYVNSIDDITYSGDSRYTTSVLCRAIKNALADAAISK